MSGRTREGAAPANPVRPVAAGAAVLLGASLGVLGWLLAQAATFGVAEHTHVTVHGMTSHRHDYAAPLAAGASVVALLAVLLLLVVHLTSSHTSHGAAPVRRPRRPGPTTATVGRLAPAVAALLFVGVEAVEFSGTGTPAVAVCGVLGLGASLQLLAAPAAAALARALVRGIEDLAVLPGLTAVSSVTRPRGASPQLAGMVASPRARVWDGRAPPARMRVLVPIR